MSDFLTSLQTPERRDEFREAIVEAGIDIGPHWRAEKYQGESILCTYELYLKTGLFCKKPLMASQDVETLSKMEAYLQHADFCKSMRIRTRRAKQIIKNGLYMIIQYTGNLTEDREAVSRMILKMGGDESDIQAFIEEYYQNEICGFVLSSDLDSFDVTYSEWAEGLAKMIEKENYTLRDLTPEQLKQLGDFLLYKYKNN